MYLFQFDLVLDLTQAANCITAWGMAVRSRAWRKPARVHRLSLVSSRRGLQRLSRRRNRVHHNPGAKPAPKTQAQRLADRTARLAKRLRKTAIAGRRKLLTRTAATAIANGRCAATARPTYWVNANIQGRYVGHCYGSTLGHDPEIYHLPPTGADMEETTTLMNFATATATTATAPVVEPIEVEEEPTQLMNFALTTAAKPVAEPIEVEPEQETTLLFNSQTLISPEIAASVIAEAMPNLGLAVPVITAVPTLGVTQPMVQPEPKPLHLQWNDDAELGKVGILGTMPALKAETRGCDLYNAIASVTLGMRARNGSPFKLPPIVEAIVRSDIHGIVPECVRGMLPGAEALAQLVSAGVDEYGGKYHLVEAGGKRQGSNAKGTLYRAVGAHKNTKATDFAAVFGVIKKQKRNRAGVAPVETGYDLRTARFFAKIVVECLLLAGENVAVVVPTQVKVAIDLYLESDLGKSIGCIANYKGINPNWFMPLYDLEYDDVESAFVRMQLASDKSYKCGAGRRPFFYVKDDVGYRVILGGGIEFVVAPGIGGGPATVHHRAAGSLSTYKLRGFVYTPAGIQGETPIDSIVKLEPLDAFWYFLESYGFPALNRPNNNLDVKGNKTEDGKSGFISRALIKTIPTQYEPDSTKGLDNRATYERAKYAMCVGAPPLPFLVMGDAIEMNHEHHAYLALGKSINSLYLELQKQTSMLSGKAPTLAMTKAINKLGLALVPTGDVSEALALDLVSIGYDLGDLHRSRACLTLMLEQLWDTFEPSMGVFQHDNLLQHVEAFWSKSGVVDAMQDAGITQSEAATSKVDAFWKVLSENFTVLLSSKQSKAVKRIAMTYSTSCPIEGEVVLGYRTADEQYNVAKLLPAVVAPNMLSMPGMGLIAEQVIKAFYSTKEQVASLTQPAGVESVWLQLVPELDAVKIELEARVEDDKTLKGFAFPTGKGLDVKVKEDTKIGTIMLADKARGHIEYADVFACENGYLKEVLFDFKSIIGGEVKLYVYAKVTQQITNTFKLRSVCALKLNTLAVRMNHYLGFNNLNPVEFKDVQLYVYGDSYKGGDNLTSKVKLAAVNYAHYAPAIASMRSMLVDANYAVQSYLGWPLVENDKYLWIDNSAIVAGIYADLIADFDARFETVNWHYERTPVADLPTIRVAHTRNRAVAALELAKQPNTKLKGQPWRFVNSDEAKTIYGLPPELIFDIEALEHAGNYTNPDLGVGNAYIVTNAVAEIKATDSISCMWSQERTLPATKMNEEQVVAEYVMLDRSYGWGPKDGLQLMFPVEVESVPIAQVITASSAMPFALVQHAIEGQSGLTESHLEQVKVNTKFDGLIDAMCRGKALVLDGNVVPLVDLSSNVAASVQLRDAGPLLSQLCDPLVYTNDLAFFKLLASVTSNCVFRLPIIEQNKTAYVTLHLPTLFAWNHGSLRVAGDSAVKAVVAWFKSWIVRANLPHCEELSAIAGSIRRMLKAYYIGKGHMKGLLRGNKSVYIKVAASSLIPSDELWICEAQVSHFKRVFGVSDLSEVTAVGFRRMPMFATNISKIRVLSLKEVNFYKQHYGVRFAAGLAYIGAAQMYSNFGDLDGDAIEIGNVSAEFNAGLCSHHNFDTIRQMMIDVLGVDNLTWAYWGGNHADQYIADHFYIGGWAKFQSKCRVSWNGNCTTRADFANFQLAAGAVQTVTVGLTYKVATLTAMFAEILPVIVGQVTSANGGETPDWVSAFSWALDRDTARITVAKLIQLYEVALGGYDKDMAKLTLGYLTRAMNAEQDVDATLPEEIREGLGHKTSGFSNFSTVSNEFKDLRKFNHLNEGVVRDALVNLGFSGNDLGTFKNCFMLAGLCSAYSRTPKIGEALPLDLRLIFDVIQSILDISQVKLDEDSNPIAFPNYNRLVGYAQAQTAAGDLMGPYILELDETIRTCSVSGALFDAYYQNYQLSTKDENYFEVSTLAVVS